MTPCAAHSQPRRRTSEREARNVRDDRTSRRCPLEAITQFLYREARSLDDKQWDDWLALYAPDVEFWMPSWDDDDRLTEDPQQEISLIWYGHKGGLEDRVFRIRTERSSATSLPEPRTSHNIATSRSWSRAAKNARLRFNWVTFSYRYKTVDTLFRHVVLHARHQRRTPLIKRKKVILKNDYIHHVVDIYHI